MGSGGQVHHFHFFVGGKVIENYVEEEAVELGFGQGYVPSSSIGSAWPARRWLGQDVGVAADGAGNSCMASSRALCVLEEYG